MQMASDQVKHVTSIGAGPIGAGWAAHFLARGYDVTTYLHDRNEEDKFMSVVNTAWPCLIDLGMPPSLVQFGGSEYAAMMGPIWRVIMPPSKAKLGGPKYAGIMGPDTDRHRQKT